MRVILSEKPFQRVGFSTSWSASTGTVANWRSGVDAIGLFALAVMATLTIFVSEPFANWAYEVGIFLLAGYCSAREILRPPGAMIKLPALASGIDAPLASGRTAWPAPESVLTSLPAMALVVI